MFSLELLVSVYIMLLIGAVPLLSILKYVSRLLSTPSFISTFASLAVTIGELASIVDIVRVADFTVFSSITSFAFIVQLLSISTGPVYVDQVSPPSMLICFVPKSLSSGHSIVTVIPVVV